jgi:hypothetical protein
MDHLLAVLADEMLVPVCGKVIHGAAVTQMYVVDDTERFE